MSSRWNPWRALRDQPEISFWFAPLAGERGLWERVLGHDTILIDETLGRRERRCVLAHELIHAERGIGHLLASDATMEKEEELVRREVARRLVPPDELRDFLDRRLALDPITAADIADEFDVDEDVAALALRLCAG